MYYYLYRWFDADGVLLYLGVTTNPVARFRQHGSAGWYGLAAKAELSAGPVASDRETALSVEMAAIKAEGPLFNIMNSQVLPSTVVNYLKSRGIGPGDFLPRNFEDDFYMAESLWSAQAKCIEAHMNRAETVLKAAAQGWSVDRMAIRLHTEPSTVRAILAAAEKPSKETS